jgi:hypothetical protein
MVAAIVAKAEVVVADVELPILVRTAVGAPAELADVTCADALRSANCIEPPPEAETMTKAPAALASVREATPALARIAIACDLLSRGRNRTAPSERRKSVERRT